MKNLSRKDFIRNLSLLSGLVVMPGFKYPSSLNSIVGQMNLGFVTYLWGKDWDIPTIIKNLSAAKIYGVELRIDHAHGVTTELSKEERKRVKKQFADSPVQVLGMGTNQRFDYPDKDELKSSIEKTKEYIKLSHDIGGSGVKVKPNGFHKNVPKEKTLEQIGKSLNEVGKFAADHGQKIRLEVHGKGTQQLPNIKTIMDVATNPNVGVCWNSNDTDLDGKGLEYNFNLVKGRFGDTAHVRELNIGDYPYQKLMSLFVQMNYNGWILLECRTNPEDKVKALIEQRKVWEKMIEQG
ncbi:MAG: sugar phosphate isomerase/epimerase [Chlorobi bacterium]|nr:sugar phosphate isomerase/epimerase [Chlorobiota bacterium]